MNIRKHSQSLLISYFTPLLINLNLFKYDLITKLKYGIGTHYCYFIMVDSLNSKL